MAGWLDKYGKEENYNNSQTSAPQGMVGDGFSNVGRNYSPAWGGQFQNGGKTPLYVESKNDPRYRAYQDSLALYNFHKNPLNLPGTLYKQEEAKVVNKAKFIEINNKEGKLPYYDMNMEKFKKNKTSTNLKDFYKPGGIDGISPRFVKDIDAYKREIINGVKGNDSFDYSKSPYYKMYTDGKYKMDKEYTQTDPKSYTQYEVDPITGVQGYVFHNFDNPSKKDIIEQVTLSSSKIKPQGVFYLGADNPITYKEMRMKKISGSGPKNDQYVSNKTYGVGIEPYYKKPTTPVFVDKNKYNPNDSRLLDLQKRLENTLLKEDINPPINEIVDIPVKRDKLIPIQNNIQPEGIQNDFNIEASLPVIRPQAKLAKYYDVTDSVNQNFGGSESHYKYYPENGPLQELAPEPYNSRTIVPHYQMGGNVYPVNYVPQAQDGYQMGTYFDEDARERNPSMMEETYDDYNTAMTGMMKSKMATQAALGNPGARRMMSSMPAKYTFTGNERFSDGTSAEGAGSYGSHYISNRGNYVYPNLQDNGEGTLNFIPNASPSDREAMRFENADEADYFANHYKEVAPMMKHYGKMQMGGSLPGAVGNMYARVGAPSNGPYAKKTMASAQNGQEMRYYQNGLDWKPKGMKDGGWLDGYEKAQFGKTLTPKQLELKKQVERNNRKIETQNKYNEYQENKRKAADLENKKAQAKSNVQANMEKAYKHPLMSPGYFTPEGAAIGAIESAVKVGPDLYKGNYGDAAINTLGALPAVAAFGPELRSIKTSIAPELRQGLRTTGPSFGSKVKSEIDWGKWNKEIPENPQLMNEYNAIEQTTKANGSWMKNPDGSAFQGTPEQFVQQNSNNFKKAFPNPVLDDAGNVQYNYHGSPNKFNEFDKTKFYSGNYGKGIYTSPDKEGILNSYANDTKSRVNRIREMTGGEGNDANLYELYINSKNPKIFDDVLELPSSIKNYGKSIEDFPTRSELYNQYSKEVKDNSWIKSDEDFDKFLSYMNKTPREKAQLTLPDNDFIRINDTRLKEQVIPFSNYPKSAVGNNGMFDMTNPNIYKAIVPGAIGLGAASQLEQKKEGGIIKDDRGQWDHPGEITEIGSNNITMEGVPYPVLGISDTGHTQMMYPGNHYKFKGKKVTEYPMAKNGVNQADENSLVKLNQLTNFTNYNTKQPGGWLSKYS